MPKNICIFSDGTGQMGGVRPDQRLSNIYKMYRAMRPGPDSPISPKDQVCFYDPGLGTAETGGMFRRIKPILASAVGTGIDHNMIDCYEQIIAHYEPGDRVLLFGFSRGAYTVRALANVMNLCGIPTRMPDGTPVPRYGPKLRKIATDAVKFVYNHGAGKPRGKQPYSGRREELGRRFRRKYSSAPVEGEDVQGNVQPHFIGVFDTVASLGTAVVRSFVWGGTAAICALLVVSLVLDWPWPVLLGLAGLLSALLWQLGSLLLDNFKFYSDTPEHRLRLWRPADWPQIWRTGHFAAWNKRNYDKWLDPDVQHARHAMAIDEDRADFPRVGWASKKAALETKDRQPEWLKQVWFPGCHSDIGGSYPESESRLSDIALDWMVTEVKECVPTIQINENMLHRHPDALALQHREEAIVTFGPLRIRWKQGIREVGSDFPLHPSVEERMKASVVVQNGDVKAYRPAQLRERRGLADYYDN
ncbi:phospholipase effector Tle1 domain-containing protein [Pseudooceanicola nanhaiensis]|uniref:phospholipase effector Tle1 domain-containing protein n=1 Tax=Pseudooceanicola nanhaiensis TaxID=375761 RepID=UPI003517AFCA